MYKVLFNDALFASVGTLEEACSLALAVHRSSNMSHHVAVLDENTYREGGDSAITFILDVPKNSE